MEATSGPKPASCRSCALQVESVFAGLDPRLLRAFERERVSHRYQPGEPLYLEATPAVSLFCLDSGLVKLYRSWPDGRRYVLGTAGPGDLVGYVSILDGRLYATTAEAVEATRACIVPREPLLRLLEDSPRLASVLIRRLSHALLDREEQCAGLAQQTVGERTARLLLKLSRGDGTGGRGHRPGERRVPGSLRRMDLAEMVGTTQETLSRTLHEFARRGWIELDSSGILVGDAQALRREGGMGTEAPGRGD